MAQNHFKLIPKNMKMREQILKTIIGWLRDRLLASQYQ